MERQTWIAKTFPGYFGSHAKGHLLESRVIGIMADLYWVPAVQAGKQGAEGVGQGVLVRFAFDVCIPVSCHYFVFLILVEQSQRVQVTAKYDKPLALLDVAFPPQEPVARRPHPQVVEKLNVLSCPIGMPQLAINVPQSPQ